MESESNSGRKWESILESVHEISQFLKSADYGNDQLVYIMIMGMHVFDIPIISGNFKEANSWKWSLQSTRLKGHIVQNHIIIICANFHHVTIKLTLEIGDFAYRC